MSTVPIVLEGLFSHLIPCANRDPRKTFRGRPREVILERFGRRCTICCKHQSESPNGLEIHHIFPRRAGFHTEPWNAIPLCGSCHRLADLNLWPPNFLLTISEALLTDRRDQLPRSISEEEVRSVICQCDADNLSREMDWRCRVQRLHDVHMAVAAEYRRFGSRLPELVAHILGAMSKVITTYVPQSAHSVQYRRLSFPLNRIVGIELATRARSLLKRFAEVDNRSRAQSILAMTQTISVHYRGTYLPGRNNGLHGRSIAQHVRHVKPILRDAERIFESGQLAYYLAGLAIDLAALQRGQARVIVKEALRSALHSNSQHWVADTLVRAAEVEMRLGAGASALELFDHHKGGGVAWDIVMDDLPIVQCIAHKVRMQAEALEGHYGEAERHYHAARRIAHDENLEDQQWKVARAYTNIAQSR